LSKYLEIKKAHNNSYKKFGFSILQNKNLFSCHIFKKRVTKRVETPKNRCALNFKNMENTKKIKQFLSNTIIINSIVWATVMLVSYLILGEDYKKINFILLSGFFIEFLRCNSAKNKLDKPTSKKD